MKVYKYPLRFPAGVEFTLELPEGAELLTMFYQDRETDPVLYARVDETKPLTPRVFQLIGTGWDAPDQRGKYVGTYTSPAGFVWHLFELNPGSKN